MAKRIAPMLFEVFEHMTGRIVGVYATQRRASNAASRKNCKGEGDGHHFVRRMLPMQANDLMCLRSDGAKMMRNKRWQRSGFWAPTDYDRVLCRWLYWH